MDTNFEQIIPWNGAQDTGRDVRLKWKRNFDKIAAAFAELLEATAGLDEKFLRKDRPDTAQAVITFLKGLTAGDFQQGSSGVGIWQDDDGNWHIETDYLDVRMKFTAREVEIQRVYHIAGAQMKTSANMKCVRVEELDDVYRCYMNTTDDDGNEITNDFKAQDQAYVQTFNLVKQADGTTGNHFLWRLVLAVGDDYIDLSKSVCAQGSDAPKAGDDIVQLGYRGTDDPNRQNAVIDAGAGEGSPYYRQFTGINSFSFPEPETQLKPGDNIVTGRMKIQPGSTGSANLTDLPDEVYKAVQIGGENLLLNTAFAGDYDSKKLDPATALQKDTQMYSPNMLHWTGNGTTVAEASAPAGFACRVGSISQPVSLISGENYVFSFYAKGNGIEMSCGGSNVSRQLSSSYQHYSMKFTYQSGGVFLLSGDATVHSLKLERGTIATDWCPSVLDPSSVADRFKGMWYLQQALKGSTQFIGGLGLTTMMQLGKWTDGVMEKVNAGISGIYNEDTDVAFWAGGTFEQAIATVRKIIGGENPSDEEWKSLAKFVATHGGDIFLRGYIYALGGVFRGTVYAEGGEFRGKFETSLNGQRIVIDPEDGSLKMMDEDDRTAVNISFSNDDGRMTAGLMITEYEGDTAWFSTRILGRSITMVNNISNYGAILLPDQIRFLSGGSELFSLSMVQDYDKGGKKVVITGSNWNETEGLAGTVYVDENGFLKVSKKEPVQPGA